jgi:phasin family protein
MSTPTPPESIPTVPQVDWAAATDQWFKACRSGFDTWLALSNAALAGAERMRMVQLEADVETQTRNRDAALGVADCRDMSGLFALQSNLATAYMESAMRYWRTLAELAQQTNAEVARLITARYDEWSRSVQGALPLPTPAGTSEVMPQAFVIAFEAARASQEAMMKSIASLTAMAGETYKRAA